MLKLVIRVSQMENEVVLSVYVIPGGKKFSILGYEQWRDALKIRTKSKAEKGLANKELEKQLARMFNSKVRILKGRKSRNKVISISGVTKQKILEYAKPV